MSTTDAVQQTEKIRQIHKELYEVDLANFQVLSTIRYDPALSPAPPQTINDVTHNNFFLFGEHIERLKFTFMFFLTNYAHGTENPGFEVLEQYIFSQLQRALLQSNILLLGPLKIRLLASFNGEIKIELYPVPIRENLLDGILLDVYPEQDTWDVYLDSEATLPSPFTSFKTTKRDAYSAARARKLPGIRPGKEEVLLYNTNNELMEGSITNFALRSKDNRWITPQLSSGCLCGVMRHALLKKNLITEETVLTSNIKVGSEVLLFNGVMGVVRGIIRE